MSDNLQQPQSNKSHSDKPIDKPSINTLVKNVDDKIAKGKNITMNKDNNVVYSAITMSFFGYMFGKFTKQNVFLTTLAGGVLGIAFVKLRKYV